MLVFMFLTQLGVFDKIFVDIYFYEQLKLITMCELKKKEEQNQNPQAVIQSFDEKGLCNICGCPQNHGGGGSSPVCECPKSHDLD